MAVKKQTFFKGVLVIMIAQIFIKLLGFIYRVVLTNFKEFADVGNSYYGSGFSVYAFLLAIATLGIPNTMSKLVSEKIAIGDRKGAHKIFKTAMLLFTLIGVVFGLSMFFGADFISVNILRNPGVKYTLMALSPAIIFVAMTATIRGYFVGMQNMEEYSKAQILEQIVNSTFSIIFVVMLLGRTPEIMAAGSTLATTLATMTSFFYLLRYYRKNRADIWKDIRESAVFKEESRKKIVKKLISYVIPISFGSIIVTLSSLVDTVTVVNCLQQYGYSLEEANVQYGILAGKVETLNALPLSINVAFSVALVPFVATAIAQGRKKDAVDKINFSIKTSGIIALPCAVGLSMMAAPIFQLLFPNASSGANLLEIQAFMVIFSVVAQTLYGALQGLGKLYVPGICLGIGIIVKYIINVTLIPIYGEIVAPIASVIYQAIACITSFILLYRYLKEKPDLKDLFGKTIIATILMAAVIYICKTFLPMFIASNTICVIATILIAVFIYFNLVFGFRIFNKDEIMELPMGAKLYSFVSKFHKIK